MLRKNTIILVYGFESDKYIYKKRIYKCKSINKDNFLYYNIIITDSNIYDIIKKIYLCKQTESIKIKNMNDFAKSIDKKAKWHLGLYKDINYNI